jgi:hypothetical protein
VTLQPIGIFLILLTLALIALGRTTRARVDDAAAVRAGKIGDADHEVIVEPREEPVPKVAPLPTIEPVREPLPLTTP